MEYSYVLAMNFSEYRKGEKVSFVGRFHRPRVKLILVKEQVCPGNTLLV